MTTEALHTSRQPGRSSYQVTAPRRTLVGLAYSHVLQGSVVRGSGLGLTKGGALVRAWRKARRLDDWTYAVTEIVHFSGSGPPARPARPSRPNPTVAEDRV